MTFRQAWFRTFAAAVVRAVSVAPAQALGARSKQFQIPSNRGAEIPKEAARFSDIKLIDYDFKKYGSSAERRRLLDKWDKEVNALPR